MKKSPTPRRSAEPRRQVSRRSTLVAVPKPPPLILEPVAIATFAELIAAAQVATRSLDRYVQLHLPEKKDLATLERLQRALAPFMPAQGDSNARPT